jgi:hypothetical protein
MVNFGSLMSVQALQKNLEVCLYSTPFLSCCCLLTECLKRKHNDVTTKKPNVANSDCHAVQDALRQLLANGSPAIQEQIAPSLSAVLPQALGNEVS